jgi:hypothetical protein
VDRTDTRIGACLGQHEGTWRSRGLYRGEITIPSRAGVRWTPLADLEGVHAEAWAPHRLSSIRQAYRDNVELPPLDLSIWKRDGTIRLGDGNHRLVAARDMGVHSILVHWRFD